MIKSLELRGEKNKEGCALKVFAVSLSQINLLGVRVES